MITSITSAFSGATIEVGGKSAVPVPINTVLADTGDLPAGDYSIEITAGYADTVLAGKGLSIEHRAADNLSTLRELGIIPAGDSRDIRIERRTVAVNESIRVVTLGVVGAAGSVASASIRANRRPTA